MMRRVRTLPGFTGRKEMRRRLGKSFVKALCSTEERHWILPRLRPIGVSGIPGVAVKCVDIGKNTRGEGGSLDWF